MKDLHIHTIYSDGEFDEFAILKEIKKSNITEFAICDHDTIEGSKKVLKVLRKQNSPLIFHTGIELTCRFKEFSNGVNMHILFLDFDFGNENLKKVIDEISELRIKKISTMVECVEQNYNIKIPFDKIEEKLKQTKSFGKPHLLSIMQEIGKFDRDKFYELMDKLDTAHLKLDAKKTIQKLKGSGLLILAHPVEVMKEYNFDIEQIEKLIASLKDVGLDGIETAHSSQTPTLQIQLKNIAQKYDLSESQGSDFHGPNIKPDVKIGLVYKSQNEN